MIGVIGRCNILDLISFSILILFSVLPKNPLNKYITTNFKFKKPDRNKKIVMGIEKIVNLEGVTRVMGDWGVKPFSLQTMFPNNTHSIHLYRLTFFIFLSKL